MATQTRHGYVIGTVEVTTEENDGAVQVTWEAGYYWTKPTPASRVERGYSLGQPAEGGIELDDGPTPIKASYYNEDGEFIYSLIEDDIPSGFAEPTRDDLFEAFEDDLSELFDTDY